MKPLFVIVCFAFTMWTMSARALEGTWTGTWLGDIPGHFHRFTRAFNAQTFDVTSSTVIHRPSRGFYLFDSVVTVEYKLGRHLRTEGDIKVYEIDSKAVRRSFVASYLEHMLLRVYFGRSASAAFLAGK